MSDDFEVPDASLPLAERMKRKVFGRPKTSGKSEAALRMARTVQPARRLGSAREAMLGNFRTEAELREAQDEVVKNVAQGKRGRIYPLQGLEPEPVYAPVENELDFGAVFKAAFPYLVGLTFLAWVLGLIGYWALVNFLMG